MYRIPQLKKLAPNFVLFKVCIDKRYLNLLLSKALGFEFRVRVIYSNRNL